MRKRLGVTILLIRAMTEIKADSFHFVLSYLLKAYHLLHRYTGSKADKILCLLLVCLSVNKKLGILADWVYFKFKFSTLR